MVTLSFLIPLGFAVAATLNKRNPGQQCHEWDSTNVGPYTIYNNLWGQSNYKGYQCLTVDASHTDPISWSSVWKWRGGPSQVKSFSNAVLKQASPQEVSIIHSIPSSWTWSYEGNAVDADVAYDMFFSPTENSEASVEVMIWLGALGGAGPIWDGATTWNVTIGAHNWTLYHGVNKYQSNFALNVYSFIRNDATGDIRTFTGDIKYFLTLLESRGFLDTSYYLQNIGAGTEAFTANSARFQTISYQVKIV